MIQASAETRCTKRNQPLLSCVVLGSNMRKKQEPVYSGSETSLENFSVAYSLIITICDLSEKKVFCLEEV